MVTPARRLRWDRGMPAEYFIKARLKTQSRKIAHSIIYLRVPANAGRFTAA